jgi:hypothetical protein
MPFKMDENQKRTVQRVGQYLECELRTAQIVHLKQAHPKGLHVCLECNRLEAQISLTVMMQRQDTFSSKSPKVGDVVSGPGIPDAIITKVQFGKK